VGRAKGVPASSPLSLSPTSLKEVAQQFFACRRQDGFGVKLDTFYGDFGREIFVADAHDFTIVLADGADFQASGQTRPLNDEGVIAGGFKGVG
jgi:hypothetical protein